MPEQSQADDRGDASTNEAFTTLVKAYIDQQIQDSQKAEDRARKKRFKNSWRSASPITKGTFILAALVSLATVAYSIIAGFQLFEMRHTNFLTQQALNGSDEALHQTIIKMQGQIDAVNGGNTLSKNALLVTQRAFIYVGKFNISPVGNIYKVNFVWSNGGTTPTRYMREVIHVRLFKGEMPDGFKLQNAAEKGTQMFVGPKADSNGKAEVLSAASLGEVAVHHGHLYIWGWARYNDVFVGTPQHLTEFCDEVTDAIYSPSGLNIVTSTCKRGNCTDDECKAN